MSPNELSQLIPIAKKLNSQSNEINDVITSLNNELASLNLGIEFWLDSDEAKNFQVGFARVSTGTGAEWQLAYRTRNDARFENAGEYQAAQPLLKASRNLRIEGLALSREILVNLKSEAETKLKHIERAKQLVAELSSSRKAGAR